MKKLYLMFIILLILCSVGFWFGLEAEGADTGFKSPSATGEFKNDWTNPTNAYSSNNSYMTTTNVGKIVSVLLSWDDGTNYTTAKTNTLTTSEATYTYGGATDTWGRTWSDTELSDTTFKLKISVTIPPTQSTKEQDFASFTFNVPAGATIDGIEVTVEGFEAIGDPANYDDSIDHVQAKVYYTAAPSNNNPFVSTATDSPDPLTIVGVSTFSVGWDDPDAGENVKAKVCKTDALSAQNCTGGFWASSTAFTTSDPEAVTYSVTASDVGSHNFYAYVCDDEGACSATSTTGAFLVLPIENRISGGMRFSGGVRVK